MHAVYKCLKVTQIIRSVLVYIAFVRTVSIVGYLIEASVKEHAESEPGQELQLIACFKLGVDIKSLCTEGIGDIHDCKGLIHAPAKGLLLCDDSL